MFSETLRQLLADVQSGAISADAAVAELRGLPFTQVGDALVDHHRALRTGTPEAIYGPGKSPEQCALIVGEMLAHGEGPVLLTRVDDAQAKAALAAHPGSLRASNTLAWRLPDAPHNEAHRVLVVSAGTADVPVVDEAVLTLRAYGYAPERIVDVGVAGIHRLLDRVDTIQSADAIIVAAGMEGALASDAGLAVEPHGFRCAHVVHARRPRIRATAAAAPNPLSMPTTVTPAAHDACMARSAVTPSSEAP